MKPILVDTSAYAAFKRGRDDAVSVFLSAPRIAINAVVLGELLSGFATGSKPEENRSELAEFLSLPNVDPLSVDEGTAAIYATIYAHLRTSGTPIPTNDMWIAASAVEHDLAIFTYDAHFRTVDGLLVGSTLSDFEE